MNNVKEMEQLGLTPAQIIERNRISTAICEEIMTADAIDKDNTDFYNSRAWRQARAASLDRDGGIDIWEYMKTGRIIPGNEVHHIVSATDNKNLRCELTNLITVSKSSHREIERLYNKADKNKIQEILQIEINRRTDEYIQSQMDEAKKESSGQLTLFDLDSGETS